MSTERDTLLLHDPKVKSAGSAKKLIAAVVVCVLFLTALHPFSAGQASTQVFAATADDGAPTLNRIVDFIAANDVMKAADSVANGKATMTHLIVSDVQNMDEHDAVDAKKGVSTLQASGINVLLQLDEQVENMLRQDWPATYSAVLAYISDWNADGVDINMVRCEAHVDYPCATADVMRLVSALRADLRADLIITLSSKAHAVFGSDHASRQKLRELVLTSEAQDEIDWINVHFEAGWTQDMAQVFVNVMQEKEYERDAIVPIMNPETHFESMDEDEEVYLSLSELTHKYGNIFGGFGVDVKSFDITADCPPCGITCC